ncbi:hypothetical protein K438DRAFT_407051 [Mycena galopus ATCC 62051]|nr:hypothetical protein K438DRAFT_407051 [Mycena galopus ATCC 62051]
MDHGRDRGADQMHGCVDSNKRRYLRLCPRKSGRYTQANSRPMDSDSSVSPLLSLACRFLPHDQWFTTHVDPDWKVKQVKSWLLAKCLPYAAPPSPPLRQFPHRKPQRPPSPITFAPDPRHRPISPITFAAPKAKQSSSSSVPDHADDDASEFELPPSDPLSGLSSDSDDPHAHPTTEPEDIILPPPPAKKRVARTILPIASTAPKGDLYAQFTLIRFSTGQLLEDDLPLSFYDMQAHELLELHRASIIVPLPRAHPARYLDAYWEGRVKVLRIRPAEGEREEDAWGLYRVKTGETRPVDWRERWLVVREGNIYLCRDETRLIHTLPLSDLVQLTNTGLPPAAATPAASKPRVLLARFASPLPSAASASTHPTSTRASSPLHNHPQPQPLTNPFDSDSDSNLSSPIFAHDSSDSNRPRRKLQYKKFRKRVEPEFLVLDLKDDAGESFAFPFRARCCAPFVCRSCFVLWLGRRSLAFCVLCAFFLFFGPQTAGFLRGDRHTWISDSSASR